MVAPVTQWGDEAPGDHLTMAVEVLSTTREYGFSTAVAFTARVHSKAARAAERPASVVRRTGGIPGAAIYTVGEAQMDLSTLLIREQDLHEELVHVTRLLDEAAAVSREEPKPPPCTEAEVSHSSPVPTSQEAAPAPSPAPTSPAPTSPALTSPPRGADLGRDGDPDAFNARSFWYTPPLALPADDGRRSTS